MPFLNDMQSSEKPIVLTFIGHYFPGNKSGGILRVTVNTVDHMCKEFEFRIVTRDRDLGENKPYPGIQAHQWLQVDNAMVYYLQPQSTTIKKLMELIADTAHDVLYLNSFFEPLTVKVLCNRKIRRGATFKPVIVAPWGEFAQASLKQKYIKKFVFIQLSRLFGLYDDVIWRASSEIEKQQIMKVMKINPDRIHITGDFPIKNIPDTFPDENTMPLSSDKGLRIIFLSRISQEKKLDYALKILHKVKARVLFDIYGPKENKAYWKECQELIGQLPPTVTANYLGRVEADQVIQLFSQYDLFLFPTGGEAYGHVIAESLTAGTSVLISTETPWRNLQADGLGWDIDLSQMDSFVETIEQLALSSPNQRSIRRERIKSKILDRLQDPAVLMSNRQLFSIGN